jgi:glycosyltransferase involved in cell wall biosynthesis
MKTNKILYISGSYYPAPGGSEQTMHSLLKALARKGYHCRVITRKENKQKVLGLIDGVKITRIDSESLEKFFGKEILEHKPEVVMTQLTWSDQVIKLANKTDLPVIYFVRSIGGNLDLGDDSSYKVEAIVSNSETTQRFVKDIWGRESTIMYPIIDREKYITGSHEARYITMVNPLKIKGGDIFKKIAEKMPDREFMAVKAWTHLRDKDGTHWDMEKMKEMAQAFNDSIHIPEEVDLLSQKNINIVGPYSDMRVVYKNTKILVVPSLWEEAFARVVVEAMLNGIPVIASNKGNLPHTVGEGGIIIKEVENINYWLEAIKFFNKSSNYKRYQIKAKRAALRFKPEVEVKKIQKLLQVIGNNKYNDN